MQRILLILLAVTVTYSCSAPKPKPPREALTGACQVRKCVCGPEGWSPFMAGGTVPPLWRENGDAYCPAGYSLHLAERPPISP